MIVTIPEHYRIKGHESRGPVIALRISRERGIAWVKLEAGAEYAWIKQSDLVTIPQKMVSLPVSLLDKAPKLHDGRIPGNDQRGYVLTMAGHEEIALEALPGEIREEDKIDLLFD